MWTKYCISALRRLYSICVNPGTRVVNTNSIAPCLLRQQGGAFDVIRSADPLHVSSLHVYFTRQIKHHFFLFFSRLDPWEKYVNLPLFTSALIWLFYSSLPLRVVHFLPDVVAKVGIELVFRCCGWVRFNRVVRVDHSLSVVMWLLS